MNRAVTSKAEILEVSRQMVMKQGIAAVSMRSIATACGVALGSLYNYFPSKGALLAETVQTVWQDIFSPEENLSQQTAFLSYLRWLFARIGKSRDRYPAFFSAHAIGFAAKEKPTGRRTMQDYFFQMKQNLCTVLSQDPDVSPTAFNQVLTREIFVDYLFTLFLSSLSKKGENYEPLFMLVSQFLYRT